MKVPVVSTLLSRLKGALGPAEGDVSSRVRSPRDVLEDDELSMTFATLLDDRESKSYGTVQILTLSQFRQDLGDIWDSYEKNILLIAETTVDRMLGRSQTAIREDDETWLLVTPDLTPGEAERFAERIASVIGEKLIGARFEATASASSDADATPLTGPLDITQAVQADGTINRSSISQALSNAQAVIAARAKAKRQEEEKAETGEQDVKPADPPAEFVSAEPGLKIQYWPAWSADSQSIDTFFCRPVSPAGGDPFRREDPRQIAANAVAIARGCAVTLNGMIKDSVRAKLVAPIPYAALMSSAQRSILQAFEKLHESHRFLYLRLEIVDVPAVVTLPTLLTARQVLEPLARDIGILTDLGTPNRVVLSASKVMIGADADASSGDVLTDLEAFHTACQGRPTYVVGLSSPQEVKTAVYAGFNEVGGSAVKPPLTKRPEGTTPMLRDKLLSGES